MLQWIHEHTYQFAGFNKCDTVIYHIFSYCSGYQALNKVVKEVD
jgi:hypothetical protein